jgi:hypothetical protein
MPRPSRLTSLTSSLTVAATGTASVDDTWARYTVPSLWSSWSPQIQSVDTAQPDAPVAAGSVGTVVGPAGVRVPFTVTHVDAAARRWTWEVRAGLVTLVLEHGVDALDARTRAWARVTGPLPVVLGYAPLARLALGRLVAA